MAAVALVAGADTATMQNHNQTRTWTELVAEPDSFDVGGAPLQDPSHGGTRTRTGHTPPLLPTAATDIDIPPPTATKLKRQSTPNPSLSSNPRRQSSISYIVSSPHPSSPLGSPSASDWGSSAHVLGTAPHGQGVGTPESHTPTSSSVAMGGRRHSRPHPSSSFRPSVDVSSSTGFPRSPLSPSSASGSSNWTWTRRQGSVSASSYGFSPDLAPASPSGTSALGRSQSMSAGARGIKREGVERTRTSEGSLHLGVGVGSGPSSGLGSPTLADAARQLKERAPVTLAEKHPDLLHFIAQKESKCLELRSQLASHEAELLQLKKKWERIVNRGISSTSTPPPTSSATSTSTSPSTSTSFVTHTHHGSPTSPSAYTHPSTRMYEFASSSGSAPSTPVPVLEGIKEGVQGVSRFLASMALGGLGEGESGNGSGNEKTGGGRAEKRMSRGMLPLRLASSAGAGVAVAEKEVVIDGALEKERELSRTKLERRTSRHGNSSQSQSQGQSAYMHGQKESQSSSSTNASGSVSTGISTLSSVTTISASSKREGRRTRESTDRESESEFGEFHSAAPVPIPIPNPDGSLDVNGSLDVDASIGSISSVSASTAEGEQVLMVRDTGAMPMMSPNPEFERKRERRERRERKGLEKRRSGSGREMGSGANAGGSGSGSGSGTSGTSTPASGESAFDAWDVAAAWDMEVETGTPQPPHEVDDAFKPRAGTLDLTGSGAATKVEGHRYAPSQPHPHSQSHSKSHQTQTHTQGQNTTLPPMSSIPGLASMGMAGPAAHQMSAWVGSVGKKWGDIRGSSTFTKNQKRASLLLSDMQQTLVSALVSPTTGAGATSPSAQPQPQALSSPLMTGPSKASHLSPNPNPSGTGTPLQRTPSACSSTSASLLDDSDHDDPLLLGDKITSSTSSMKMSMSTPVLVPSPVTVSPVSSVSPVTPHGVEGVSTTLGVGAGAGLKGKGDKKFEMQVDDDEWNW